MAGRATRLPNDDASGGVDYYVSEEERSSVNEDERSREKWSENDVTDNETAATRRPHQMNRLVGRKMKTTSQMN